MANDSFQKIQCWQTDRIPKVIGKVAIEIDRANFLATHTPFNRITYKKSPAQVRNTSEENFLEELIDQAEKDRHTFAVIEGIPGTGKSHLIRWLYEKYLDSNKQKGSPDTVLLIEKANNSLRGTLLQILESGVLEGDLFEEQKRKLEGAMHNLGADGLEETLINNLYIANLQVIKGEINLSESKIPGGGIVNRLNEFLLDKIVRDELRRKGGPIKRLTQFLTGGNTRRDQDELPRFTLEDMEFDTKFKRALLDGDGYEGAKDLVRKLELPRIKHDTVNYLNELLDFAISQTTALTSEDLKFLFNKLRIELRNQGKNLVLFVEDITSFTGLDIGLVDILATRHLGKASNNVARLVSVVGITDDYYQSRFPDNIRERITHHLILHEEHDNEYQSELLTDDETRIKLAGRYLNAIRLDGEKVDAWSRGGANDDALPNHCIQCQFRQACHEAFGSVEITTRNEAKVGLYPFNRQSLLTMYNNLDTTKAKRTPRSFLNSILEYVLLSHGDQVKDGRFPPNKTELGNDFQAPQLVNPMQRQILNDLPIYQREQLETLAVFWGDRTLEEGKTSTGKPTFAGLTESVYRAFDLPYLGKQQPRKDQFEEAVDDWLNGQALRQEIANVFANLISDFLREEIVKSDNGVSQEQVQRRIRADTIAFEGGRGDSGEHQLTFSRSDNLALALKALYMLRESATFTGKELTAYRTQSKAWFDSVASQVIEFVTRDIPIPDDVLVDIGNWINGEPLRNSARLAEEAANYIRRKLDWQKHGMTQDEATKRLYEIGVAFESQASAISPDAILFTRSELLGQALSALHQLAQEHSLGAQERRELEDTLEEWLAGNKLLIVERLRKKAPKPDPVITAIEDWRNGKPLNKYWELSNMLVDFLKDAVDWQSHRVPAPLLDERLKPGAFVIEGQTGKNLGYFYELKRSDELAFALIALRELSTNKQLKQSQYGAHLVAVGRWLRMNEENVVNFICQSDISKPAERSLAWLITQESAALACLAGELDENATSLPELYRSVMTSCSTNQVWSTAIEESGYKRTSEWLALMRRGQINDNVTTIRQSFIQAMDIPVSAGSSILYLDAATVLDSLADLQKVEWQFKEMALSPRDRVWTAVSDVYMSLATHFSNVLDAEKASIDQLCERIERIAGDATGNEIEGTINDLLARFVAAQIPFSEDLYRPREFDRFDGVLGKLRALQQLAQQREAMPAALSGALKTIDQIKQYVAYLESLELFLEQKEQTWQIEMGGDHHELKEKIELVEALYDRLCLDANKLAAEAGSNDS